LNLDTARAIVRKFAEAQSVAHVIAKAYMVLLVLAASWAWWIDVSMGSARTEHLLPNVVLAALTLPSSLLLSPLYAGVPRLFAVPFVQLGFLTLCALVQAATLFWLAGRLARARKAESAA
jgi:hypothetical protein